MEVKMQTSFIPKKPITENRSGGSGVSLFLLLSVIIFIVSIALAVWVWLLQKSLVERIENDKIELVKIKDKYEKDTIDRLIRLNDRIEESKKLLSQHIAISPVFTLLEQKILKNVQLKTMKFSYAGSDKIKIDLAGTAFNYDALSKQATLLGEISLKDYISQIVVSDFSPNVDGRVSFNLSASAYPKLISYGDNIVDTQVVSPTVVE